MGLGAAGCRQRLYTYSSMADCTDRRWQPRPRLGPAAVELLQHVLPVHLMHRNAVRLELVQTAAPSMLAP